MLFERQKDECYSLNGSTQLDQLQHQFKVEKNGFREESSLRAAFLVSPLMGLLIFKEARSPVTDSLRLKQILFNRTVSLHGSTEEWKSCSKHH